MKSLVYLDLDRTLFQTNKALQIWVELAKLYPQIDPKRAYAERKQFYVWASSETYYHDFSAQIVAYGLEPDTVYPQLAQSTLADGRFEFEGVSDLVQFLKQRAQLKVLTFGADDYQRLKAALCPSLYGVEVITTLEPKEKYLKTVGECWLVDDKPLNIQECEMVHFTQVNLEHTHSESAVKWPIFTNLKDVKEYLDEKLS